MNSQDVLTPELFKALGNYIPTPSRLQQPPATPVVSRSGASAAPKEGHASLLKINKS